MKYPYVRGVLIQMWREALNSSKNPLEAWKSIIENPEKAKAYKQARGKGGFVRAEWSEVLKLISASLLYTIAKYGPDRNVGFSPIPAMSMLSHAAGSRFMSLIGGPMLSFYDWYADLPPASPQIWGDQTDVPESSDWYNSGYIMTWGSNVPLTRTPDAHFLAEARYKGAKVISISPDFAESSKFSDDWLSIRQGTDGALAMAMGHVILQDFYVNQKTERFIDYAKQYTDFPFLVTLKEENGTFTAGRFLHAKDIGRATEHDEWKPAVWDEDTDGFAIPQGTMGSRWDGQGKWNLRMVDEDSEKPITPRLSMLGHEDMIGTVNIPYFSHDGNKVLERPLPIKKMILDGEEVFVSTVFDLTLANYGVNRGIDGQTPASFDDPEPFTPAWQEPITGIKSEMVIKIAREFAQNAIDTEGRSMIIVGAGINHWFNSDTIYRAVLNLVLLVGAQGVNGGGWAHYVGQENSGRPKDGRRSRRQKTGEALPNCKTEHHFSTSLPISGAMKIRKSAGLLPLSQKHRATSTTPITMCWRQDSDGFHRIRRLRKTVSICIKKQKKQALRTLSKSEAISPDSLRRKISSFRLKILTMKRTSREIYLSGEPT